MSYLSATRNDRHIGAQPIGPEHPAADGKCKSQPIVVGDIVQQRAIPQACMVMDMITKAGSQPLFVLSDQQGILLDPAFPIDALTLYNGKFSFVKEGITWLEGECIQGKLDGYGKIITADFVYAGCWKNDQMEGYGAIHWFDGSSYEGYFLRDRRHGMGVYIDIEGVATKGYWHLDTLIVKTM